MSAISPAVTRPAERSGLPWLIIVAGSIIAMLTSVRAPPWGSSTADACRERLGPDDLRPGNGVSKSLLGPWPTVLRRDRRQVRHLARARALRPRLCRGTDPDGLRGCADLAAYRAAYWSAGALRRVPSASCFSAFARNVAPEQRSLAFGIGTAAGSAGMFLFAPLSQGLISAYGWSDSLVYLGLMMLLVPLFAIPPGAAILFRAPVRGIVQADSRGSAQRKRSGTRAIFCSSRVSSSAAIRSLSSPRIFRAYIGHIGIDARYA